jgi:hypothetical protein
MEDIGKDLVWLIKKRCTNAQNCKNMKRTGAKE